MSQPPDHPRDPIGWCLLVAAAFAILCAIQLGIPSKPNFDETHYLPAARTFLEWSQPVNLEHPPLGKELIALSILLFGDNPPGWRILPLCFGVLTLYAAMRALWFASLSRFATLAFGVLLVTGFLLIVQSRIAMLDIFMAGFVMLALWMCAGAMRENETGRWRLAIAGAALGCAMATKWNAVPLAMLPGLAFLALRMRAAGWSFVTARRGAPVAGMRLPEAGLWLGALPLAVYSLAFWPFPFFAEGAVAPGGFFELQRRMLELQTEVLAEHPYQSRWYHWVFNWRAIWYLYENVDGAQRGVLLLGNPLTMLAGLPGLAWCAWAGIARGRADALAVAVLYAASMAVWLVASKNVQFYYHYLLPSCFLLAALALALDEMARRGWRGMSLAVLAISCLLLAKFWPILTAGALDDPGAFARYTWLPSWR